MNLGMIKENIEKYKSHLSDHGLTDRQQEDYIMTVAVFLDRIIEESFNRKSEERIENSSVLPSNMAQKSKRTRTSNRLKYKRILKISQS
jgi:hypothetical protein